MAGLGDIFALTQNLGMGGAGGTINYNPTLVNRGGPSYADTPPLQLPVSFNTASRAGPANQTAHLLALGYQPLFQAAQMLPQSSLMQRYLTEPQKNYYAAQALYNVQGYPINWPGSSQNYNSTWWKSVPQNVSGGISTGGGSTGGGGGGGGGGDAGGGGGSAGGGTGGTGGSGGTGGTGSSGTGGTGGSGAADQTEANFDAAAYLRANPDVADPANWSLKNSPYEHWLKYGKAEGRAFPYANSMPMSAANFDEAAYLAANPDVASGWSKKNSVYDHWLRYGQFEGRQFPFRAGLVDTNTDDFRRGFAEYLNANGLSVGSASPAAPAAAPTTEAALQTKANFDAAAYLAANPDVAAGWSKKNDPYDHWRMYGQNEGRQFTYKPGVIDVNSEDFKRGLAEYLNANGLSINNLGMG